MSYGVLASKTLHLNVERTARSGAGTGDLDTRLDRFEKLWGTHWVPGRLTLTAIHLTFVPTRTVTGSTLLTLTLSDVEHRALVNAGRLNSVLQLHLPHHVVHLRGLAAPPLSKTLEGLGVATRGPRLHKDVSATPRRAPSTRHSRHVPSRSS